MQYSANLKAKNAKSFKKNKIMMQNKFWDAKIDAEVEN
jgi:hypothetical protein